MGTAGTGKTRAIQTLLQRMQDALTEVGLPMQCSRAAAPTGSAAFNIRFNATTLHRLMHWFSPPYFQALQPDSTQLAQFQTFLEDATMILIDEISMVGRQMMGRLDSRLRQGCAARPGSNASLGGI